MVIDIQKLRGELIGAGMQVFFLAMAVRVNARWGWLLCLALLACVNLISWLSALQRRRAITDTPTSRIASAAQGLVELRGRGCAIEPPLASRISGLPCLWYRFEVSERRGNEWEVVDEGESSLSFVLDDGSGQCLVVADGAEISTEHKQVHKQGGQRIAEWMLLPGDTIYVRGEFRTLGGGTAELDVRQDMIDLLNEWKRDQATLLARFDLNGDGKIDMQEWELARKAARREVARMHSELRNSADVHTIGYPQQGQQPYLISNINPQRLARRFLLWSFFHLFAFLLALAFFARQLSVFGSLLSKS